MLLTIGRSTTYALEVEKIHAEMYRKAKEAIETGRDIELGKVYICGIYGASKESFKIFE